MRSAFSLQKGVLSISMSAHVMKNVALNFAVCWRVGVLGTKKISVISSTENHYRKKSVGQPHMNTHHFHDLQLQLSLKLRVINYCAFRSQNNSESLLT